VDSRSGNGREDCADRGSTTNRMARRIVFHIAANLARVMLVARLIFARTIKFGREIRIPVRQGRNNLAQRFSAGCEPPD
jgi:hypothetical protein